MTHRETKNIITTSIYFSVSFFLFWAFSIFSASRLLPSSLACIATFYLYILSMKVWWCCVWVWRLCQARCLAPGREHRLRRMLQPPSWVSLLAPWWPSFWRLTPVWWCQDASSFQPGMRPDTEQKELKKPSDISQGSFLLLHQLPAFPSL